MNLIGNKSFIKTKPLSLKRHYERRNKILIVRNRRGVGDIFMHRMLFEDFKKQMPDCHLTFACHEDYHCLVKDHPYLDNVISEYNYKEREYALIYDTTNCCIFYESNHKVADKHRADIWAEHCGIKLTAHNMHLNIINDEQIAWANQLVAQKANNKPTVLFCPYAFEALRSLTSTQIVATVDYLQQQGYFVYSVHNIPDSFLESLKVHVFAGYALPEWLAFIHAADYVVSVDTASFHYAGGIKKHLTGIFTHVDGKYRGQYYDFTLVQKHRDNGNWPCGPCYNYLYCDHTRQSRRT